MGEVPVLAHHKVAAPAGRLRWRAAGPSQVRLQTKRLRLLAPRQLPTDRDYAVSTREYQSDQPSQKLLDR